MRHGIEFMKASEVGEGAFPRERVVVRAKARHYVPATTFLPEPAGVCRTPPEAMRAKSE